MATLQSPGVSVSIINESFYTPAAPGTVPLIFVATGANKTNSAGTGTAPGTTTAFNGQVWTITSQRDLTETFGTPKFYTDASNNPVHGGELNEYGLQAAYSVLGVSSKAYVVRADIDLGQLVAKSSEPVGAPANSSYWLDTSNTKFGIFEWNIDSAAFSLKTVSVIDSTNSAANTVSGDGTTIKPSYGAIGSYAITTDLANTNTVQYKNTDGKWVAVGSSGETSFANNNSSPTFVSNTWVTSHPTVAGYQAYPNFAQAAGNLVINGSTVAISTASTVITIASYINSQLHTNGVGAKVNSLNKLDLYVDAYPGQLTITGTASTLGALGIDAGTYAAPSLFIGQHTQYPDFTVKPTGSVYVKTTSPNDGAIWNVKQYSGTSQAWTQKSAPIYADGASAIYALDKAGGGSKIPVGTLFIESNFSHGNGTATTSSNFASFANFKILRRAAVAPTTITSDPQGTPPVLGNGSVITIKETEPNSSVFENEKVITLAGTNIDALVTAINGAGLSYTSAVANPNGTISITHRLGGDIKFKDPSAVLSAAGFVPYAYNTLTDVYAGTNNFYAAGAKEVDRYTRIASNWEPLIFTAAKTAPVTTPTDGTLWYNSVFGEVDIMYHNGSQWIGYLNAFPGTDPKGPIIAATEPLAQSDGTALVNGDIWIKSGNTDRYGHDNYVFNGATLKWELQDPTDQTSPNGWVFHDARWADNGVDTTPSTIVELLTSNYVDPDCVDPALYPRGTRLWNTRRSGFNVKEFMTGYINLADNNGINIRTGDPMDGSNSTTPYSTSRWVTVSPNNADGSGTFGRFAQRAFVVKSLKSLVDTNQRLRDTDTTVFNLMACPGYPELTQNLVNLNQDRAQTAFVIGDTPFRLEPTGTALTTWGAGINKPLDNGDSGATTFDDYAAFFYPSGYTTDNTGNYIVVPPSHMMLRTFINSDAKSYQWFAPAGIRRGAVENASSVGYINSSGEFTQAALPQGVRDSMALSGVRINPIATLNGAGVVNFGNYTRSSGSSALDRINVARLVAFLRRQLDILVRPFLFEPNDQLTRNEVKNSVESFLLELVGQRALYDFIVVCDTSNNTAARIDRSELWIDIAIEPVKAVEFIYIPVRLLNTGAIKSGNYGQVTNG
jgi:hypothetical protein